MIYNFKGKNITIPDSEIEIAIKNLNISRNEAIQMYLEDNDYLENAEVEQLTKKAKENRAVQHKAKAEKGEKKEVKRERKPDEEKEKLIQFLYEALREYNPTITNKTKIIEFSVNENEYKLDLVKKRKEKK